MSIFVRVPQFAIDTRRRDATFGIRRTLGDYARMARLVGALTPGMMINFRKLAQSLDEAAAVLLVMMGEALANIGFNSGQYLLQAPYSELQVRRDSAIYALRNLNGSTQGAYAPNEWPRGIDAYRQIFNFLEDQGQGDLRALLVENELTRVMDVLIQRSGQGSPEGLRQLGATAQLDIERLRRLVIIVNNAVRPASPPLAAFLEGIQLFVDAFDPAGGSRLLKIARPPILFYGLYSTSGLDSAERRLLDIVIQRGVLADQLDCFAQCGCTAETVKCQILLDKILYDIDRAIDLYAVGSRNFGEPERRAGAYGFVIQTFLNPTSTLQCLPSGNQTPITISIRRALQEVLSRLLPSSGLLDLDPTAFPSSLIEIPADQPQTIKDFRKRAVQELQIQLDQEKRWQSLVKSMAPDCIPFDSNGGVFGITEQVLNGAIISARGNVIVPRQLVRFNLPSQYENSLQNIANELFTSPNVDTALNAQNIGEIEDENDDEP